MRVTRRQLTKLIHEAMSDNIHQLDHAYVRKIKMFRDELTSGGELFADAVGEYVHQIEQSGAQQMSDKTNSDYSRSGQALIDIEDTYINCYDYGLAVIKDDYFDMDFAGIDYMTGLFSDAEFEPHDNSITDYTEFTTGKLLDTGLTPSVHVEVPQQMSSDRNKAHEDEWSRRAMKFKFMQGKEDEFDVVGILDEINVYLVHYAIINMYENDIIEPSDLIYIISDNMHKKTTGKFVVNVDDSGEL